MYLGTASPTIRGATDTERRHPGAPPGVAALAVGALAALVLAACSSPTGVGASAAPSDPTPPASAIVNDTYDGASPPVAAPPASVPHTEPTTGTSGDSTTAGADEAGTTRLVTPVVVHAGIDAPSGTVRVDAFIPGLLEDGGTCTATLTRGAVQVSATASAAADATATWCTTVGLRLSDLETGTWEAVVEYTSSSSAGTSPPVTVEVP